jgi:hypothetical protein
MARGDCAEARGGVVVTRLQINLSLWAIYLAGVGNAKLFHTEHTTWGLVGVFVVSCSVTWLTGRLAS